MLEALHGCGEESELTSIELFIGGLTRIDDEGQSTGIFKTQAMEPIRLGHEGFVGDVQADRRVHGGLEKAVHHFAAGHYERLAANFPDIAAQLTPGSIGENISSADWDEHSVCIGDVFSLGEARVQVSQPRSPCWKIDHRYAKKGVARYISETGLTGWYYRVLEAGIVDCGDHFQLLDRLPGAVSLNELWQVWAEHRPDQARLSQVSKAPGLNPGWKKKLISRLNWLQANAPDSKSPVITFHVEHNSSLGN